MARRLLGAAVVAVILLAGWLAAAGITLHQGLESDSRLTAHRLKEPIEILLQKAYHSKDDLALLEAIQALARAPGVSFACVLDRDDKVISHSRVSQLGKPFKLTGRNKDIYSFPLRDEQSRWGTLVFSMSNQGKRILWVRQFYIGTGAALLVFAAFCGWCFILESRLVALGRATAERDALLAEEDSKHRRLLERFQTDQKIWRSWAQSAVNQVPQGLLLLDQRQRVVAANPQAARRLNASDAAALWGTSWPEIPLLQACGGALEKSLLSPGVEIETANPNDGSALVFSTLNDGSGTWVRLFASKCVVECGKSVTEENLCDF